MKPIIKYPGSKYRIAEKIVRAIPDHHSYLEPFFGSGAVFFNKRPSKIETINDLDCDIPNLFKCIRDDPERIARMITMTPYSRYEYETAFRSESTDDYERALKFLICCWQGYGYRTSGKVGWKNDVQGRESAYALRSWYNLPEQITLTAERLRRVQIECRPALEVIRRFNSPNVFMYIDPPLFDRHEKREPETVQARNDTRGAYRAIGRADEKQGSDHNKRLRIRAL